MAGELTSFWLARGRGVVVGASPPVPPVGFMFLTDSDGAYLRDSDGFYLIERI